MSNQASTVCGLDHHQELESLDMNVGYLGRALMLSLMYRSKWIIQGLSGVVSHKEIYTSWI